MRCFNPFAFRPWEVTIWTTLLYAALIIPLVWIHETVPPAPSDGAPYAGIDLAAAWKDLTQITKSYHPYNSRANDAVRSYLLGRIRNILDENDADWMVEGDDSTSVLRAENPSVVVFDDMISNLTVVSGSSGGTAIGDNLCSAGSYFEGTNIVVYIRGVNDPAGDWWRNGSESLASSDGGVLVNAHYDSVSSGYGATDDGVGVVTILQLISYFTTPGRQPRFGILAMLNNGEEDFLWGARAFGQSPLMPFVHTFLNLEGAGAGGRAILFRTTDKEVTKAYSPSPNPFGSVVAADGFAMGLIHSQTDYVVLHDVYGQRGLDLAFYEPRTRYHTNQDDARHTSKASLWHMLSASIETMENLSNSMAKFTGPRSDEDANKVQNGKPSDGVWFDLFGAGFAVFSLQGLFAWSLTIVVTGPIILLLVSYVLHRFDRYYFFAGRISVHAHMEDDPINIKGHMGFFRFPIALAVSTGLVVGSAFLLRKLNPLIIYSSSYAVFAMMLSLWYFVFWAVMSGFDYHRPSALHRGYIIAWLYSLSWLIVVGVIILETQYKIASGYPFVILHSGLFLAMFITLVEMAFLPSKRSWAEWVHDVHQVRESVEPVLIQTTEPLPSPRASGEEDEEAADESTPLIGDHRQDNQLISSARISFGNRFRRSISEIVNGPGRDMDPQYGKEQRWSGSMPTSLWFLQLLFIAPMTIITIGQLALFILTATSGTGADGSSFMFPYIVAAAFSVLLWLPVTPFIHRVKFHIPILLFAIFVGTLLYSLFAFPFSPQHRYKVYFKQQVDLDKGTSKVIIDGIEEFTRLIVGELPSAAGKVVDCSAISSRNGLVSCAYDASEFLPNVSEDATPIPLQDLIAINITRPDSSEAKAVLKIDAVNTRACFLQFDQHVTTFTVRDGSPFDDRFGDKSEVCKVNLFRRDWDKVWKVDIEWEAEAGADPAPGTSTLHGSELDLNHDVFGGELRARIDGEAFEREGYVVGMPRKTRKPTSTLKGKVVCLWSDVNVQGTIPAYDEALKYAPTWVAITKAGVGLVEGSKAFTV